MPPAREHRARTEWRSGSHRVGRRRKGESSRCFPACRARWGGEGGQGDVRGVGKVGRWGALGLCCPDRLTDAVSTGARRAGRSRGRYGWALCQSSQSTAVRRCTNARAVTTARRGNCRPRPAPRPTRSPRQKEAGEATPWRKGARNDHLRGTGRTRSALPRRRGDELSGDASVGEDSDGASFPSDDDDEAALIALSARGASTYAPGLPRRPGSPEPPALPGLGARSRASTPRSTRRRRTTRRGSTWGGARRTSSGK